MKHEVLGRRRATNITLPEELVTEARRLNVNLSQAAETGVTSAVRAAAKERWRADNAEWIAMHRQWVDENALPLERYRLF